MSYGTMVYSSNGVINASANEIVIGKHTSAIYFLNTGTAAIQITLNGSISVYIPGTATGMTPEYFCIPGDYVRFQSNVNVSNLSIYAVA